MPALDPARVLAVGCAYGHELDLALSRLDLADSRVAVTAIDVAEVERDLRACKFAKRLGERLHWRRLDLLDCHLLEDYGAFDVVQCGFVLHDIKPAAKERALATLARALRPGGFFVLSDFFICGEDNAAAQTDEIYQQILDEALDSFKDGRLESSELAMLLGDGLGPGLLSTKEEAFRGHRDFFDSVPRMLDRAARSGLECLRVVRNPLNQWLAILVMRRACQ
jgi:SAM-dependent methyltransferase